MHYLIQYLPQDSSLQKLVEVLICFNLPFTEVKALPFTGKIVAANQKLQGENLDEIPELDLSHITDNIVTFGSYGLANIAKRNNWVPGAFINDNFEFDAWANGWGLDNMLNHDTFTVKLGECIIPPTWENVFTRPFHDTKSFSGTIFDTSDFYYWKNQVIEAKSHQLNSETLITIAPTKQIYFEVRCFVVDGKIVSVSYYKQGSTVYYTECNNSAVFEFASSMINKWQPDRAFVMDIADTPDGLKIIEVNNFNSSGFYACDLQKIVMAIENMEF